MPNCAWCYILERMNCFVLRVHHAEPGALRAPALGEVVGLRDGEVVAGEVEAAQGGGLGGAVEHGLEARGRVGGAPEAQV